MGETSIQSICFCEEQNERNHSVVFSPQISTKLYKCTEYLVSPVGMFNHYKYLLKEEQHHRSKYSDCNIQAETLV